MEILRQQNSQIIELLQLHFGMKQPSHTLYERLKGFPMKTMEQFFELENNNSDEILQKVVSNF